MKTSLPRIPGEPPLGFIWLVCDLRISEDAEVAAFEQAVLGATAFHWSYFWTTPPLRPQQAVFEIEEETYRDERETIARWVEGEPAVTNARVVQPTEQRATS